MMRRIIKNIPKLLRGHEEGWVTWALFIIAGVILVAGGAIYGAVKAGGAMGTYSSSPNKGHDAASGPDTAESRQALEEVQHTHRQVGLPVMTPVLEAGIRAQGAGGPQGFGISYTGGRLATSAVDWATTKNSSGPQKNTTGVSGGDLESHTATQDTTNADAGTGGAGGTGGTGGSGCSDGH
jgi:hypothetical protein